MDIPIYLITGFLESGKTSFIKDTLSDPEFTEGCRTLLVVLEEGIEEYDEAFLKENHIDLVVVEDADDMGEKFFVELHKKYNPQRVMIEYNGVWKLETVFKKKMPKEWALAQIIATVDASAFKVQLNNIDNAPDTAEPITQETNTRIGSDEANGIAPSDINDSPII